MNWSDPIVFIGGQLNTLLLGWGLAPDVATAIMKLIGAAVVGTFSLVFVIFTIWLERKVYARVQDRLGPNRVGPWGILQTFPDMVKIFTKEYITPDGADKVVYNLAPILFVSAVLLLWAVIPYSKTLVGSELNVGVLYIVAVGAIGTLSLIMAGWSSNNKYALLGAFRAVAQMVSYEVPMVLALLVPVILSGTMGINGIVEAQKNVWFFVASPIAMLMFFISSQAEIGRAPFDLLEAESELIAGYQIEYSGLKFGMFYVGDFLHAFTVSAVMVSLFFGGWQGPFANEIPLLGIAYFYAKTFLVYFFLLVVRISMPRLRIDQLLNFNWKFLTPIALVLLMATALVQKVAQQYNANLWVTTLAHLVVNLLIAWVTVEILRRFARGERARVGETRAVAMAPKS